MKTMSMIIGLSVCLLGLPASAEDLTAEQVAQRLQKMYEKTKDFKAKFTQTYSSKAMGKKKVSSGFIYVKKPGMMRWDYKKPRPKHFVADGKALYIYDPELEQVMVDRSFTSSDLSTALTFLWGKGKLLDEFTVVFAKKDAGDKAYVLELTPKSKHKARFRKLWFTVARDGFQVTATTVEDPGGNINQIVFSKMKTNVGLKDSAFEFQMPDGVDVIEAPGK
jgi:outer membrane lipoprotein carrier protein